MTNRRLQRIPSYREWSDRWTASSVVALVFLLGVAVEGGVVGLLAGLTAVLAAAIAYQRGLRLFEISIAVVPVMFYVSIGVRYNVSVGDALIVILAVQAVHLLANEEAVDMVRPLRALVIFLAFLLAAVGASIAVANLEFAGESASARALTETSKLLVCALYSVVYLVLALDRVRRRDLRFLQVWVWSSVTVAVLACLSLFVQIPGYAPFSEWRATGSFEDPNLLGAYLLCSLGLVIAYNRMRGTSPMGSNVIAILLGVIATGSRAAMLVLAAGIVIAFVGGIARSGRVDIPSVISAIAAVVTSPLWLPFVLSAGGRGEFSLADDSRFEYWQLGIDEFVGSPLLGVGYGQFPLLVAEYLNQDSYFVMHNTFLSFFVETGIIGGVLVLGGYGFVFARLVRFASTSLLSSGCALGLLMLGLSLLSINGQNVRFVWVFVMISFAVGFVEHQRRTKAAGESVVLSG